MGGLRRERRSSGSLGCAGALENGITEAIIVGRQRDGSLYVAAANGDAEKAAGMLMRAVHMLLSKDWTPETVKA